MTMQFLQKLWRIYLGKFGLTGDEYPGIGRDIALAIPLGLATLVLVVYPSESYPPERLKYAAVISLVILAAGLLAAKRKLIVIGGIAAIVGLRGLVAAAQGLWQGFAIASIATVVAILCVKRSTPAKDTRKNG